MEKTVLTRTLVFLTLITMINAAFGGSASADPTVRYEKDILHEETTNSEGIPHK